MSHAYPNTPRQVSQRAPQGNRGAAICSLLKLLSETSRSRALFVRRTVAVAVCAMLKQLRDASAAPFVEYVLVRCRIFAAVCDGCRYRRSLLAILESCGSDAATVSAAADVAGAAVAAAAVATVGAGGTTGGGRGVCGAAAGRARLTIDARSTSERESIGPNSSSSAATC